MLESSLAQLTSQIVAAYVSKNAIPVGELPDLIRSVYAVIANPAPAAQPVQEDLKPAVSVRRSVTPDYIICLEDGKKLKMLKRHLRTTYDMTPEEYRARWNLPADYPMVAPNYAATRSELAKAAGLGQSRKHATIEEGPGTAPKRRGRRQAA